MRDKAEFERNGSGEGEEGWSESGVMLIAVGFNAAVLIFGVAGFYQTFNQTGSDCSDELH